MGSYNKFKAQLSNAPTRGNTSKAGAEALGRLTLERDEACEKLKSTEQELATTYNEGVEQLLELDAAREKLSDAHCLLEQAAAAVDPEEHPELSGDLFAALEPCGLPQCTCVSELEGDLREARERIAKVAAWGDLRHDASTWSDEVAEGYALAQEHVRAALAAAKGPSRAGEE